MMLQDTHRGEQHFNFEHSAAYQKTQFLFLDAVETLQPDAIMVSTETV